MFHLYCLKMRQTLVELIFQILYLVQDMLGGLFLSSLRVSIRRSAKDRGRAGHALVGGNFFVDTFQIVFLAVAAGGPPFVALCLSCSTLVAGLFMLWKKHKVRLFPFYPAQSCFLHRGGKDSHYLLSTGSLGLARTEGLILVIVRLTGSRSM